jgi:hypothetical protein
MDHPDAKKHLIVSVVKSSIRIAGSIVALLFYSNPQAAVMILAATYGIAEIVGVYEELV